MMTEKEERNDFCKEKVAGLSGEDRDFAVPKRNKRATESDEKRADRLKQQEIFIPQQPELALI